MCHCSVFDINEVTNGVSKDAARTFAEVTEAVRREGFFVTMTFSVRGTGLEGEYTSKLVLLKFDAASTRNALLTGLRCVTTIEGRSAGTCF